MRLPLENLRRRSVRGELPSDQIPNSNETVFRPLTSNLAGKNQRLNPCPPLVAHRHESAKRHCHPKGRQLSLTTIRPTGRFTSKARNGNPLSARHKSHDARARQRRNIHADNFDLNRIAVLDVQQIGQPPRVNPETHWDHKRHQNHLGAVVASSKACPLTE